MTRIRHKATQPGHRCCNKCHQEFPATAEFFYRSKSHLLGLGYECKPCQNARKKGRDMRKYRWSNMTPDQKIARRIVTKRYSQTQMGRACGLRKAYEKTDACDLSAIEVFAIITTPCVFCGTTEVNRGLDRIDNSKPHVKGNVQCACTDCNLMRGNRFSVEEMMVLGKVVAQIRANRHTASPLSS